MNYLHRTGHQAALMVAIFAAASLALAVQTKPAVAGNNWIGPAIAGVIVGAAIAHAHHHHKYRAKRYYKRRHVRHYRRPRHVHGYYAPVVVVPFPFIAFGVHSHW